MKQKDECHCKGMHAGPCSNAVYGLGFVGAAIFFLQQATTFWEGVVGIGKAIVWPAFLIFEAFKQLQM